MEAELERLFSGSKVRMTDKRNQMKAEDARSVRVIKIVATG
jgi:hypothetical protein